MKNKFKDRIILGKSSKTGEKGIFILNLTEEEKNSLIFGKSILKKLGNIEVKL